MKRRRDRKAAMGISFRQLATATIVFAVIVAALNLYINLVVNTSLPDFQLDMSVDGDLFGFHEVEQQADHHHSHKVVGFQPASAHNHDKNDHKCPGLCPPSNLVLSQNSYVEQLLKATNFTAFRESTTTKLDLSRTIHDFEAIWQKASRSISSRRLYDPLTDITDIIYALQNATIKSADVSSKGTQVKLILQLNGGQKAVFKPRFYDREAIFTRSPYEGADRHNGEIVAFHLSRLLGFNRAPISAGRRVNLRTDVFRVAEAKALESFFDNENGQLCFYRRGKCQYCTKDYAACADVKTNLIEAVLILWLPETSSTLQRVRQPWARTYVDKKSAPWEQDVNFCRRIPKDYPMFSKAPLFLDLMDTALFDFLISNADRHRVEMFENTDAPMICL